MQENNNYRPDSIYAMLRKWLYDNGLSEEQADAVLTQQIAHDEDRLMKGRWNDRLSDYPPMMMGVLLLNTKDETLKYIAANIPQHWARPTFTRDPEEALRQMQAAGDAAGSKPNRD